MESRVHARERPKYQVIRAWLGLKYDRETSENTELVTIGEARQRTILIALDTHTKKKDADAQRDVLLDVSQWVRRWV